MQKIDEPLQITEEVERSVCVSLEDLTAIYVLGSIKGFGPQKFKELYTKGIKATDIISGREVLPMVGKRADKFRAKLKVELEKQRSVCRDRAIRQISTARRLDAVILTYSHPSYPRNVIESNNPIPILYTRGSLKVLQNRNAVACVGSRQIRPPYIQFHENFSRAACRLGFVIVSGFALGADSIGHSVARDAGGQTICIMPSGLDRPFPPENKRFWENLLIYEGAALISEFPFGTGASALTLRKRNKLIVSCALGVLVSQSSVGGGAMNAFRFALEQRKPVATFAPDDQADTSGNAYAEKQSSHGVEPQLNFSEKPRKSRYCPEITVFSSTAPEIEAYKRWLQALSSSI